MAMVSARDDAEAAGEILEGPALGDADAGADRGCETSRAGYSVRTHSQLAAHSLALRACSASFILLTSPATIPWMGSSPSFKARLQRLDDFNGIAVGLDPEGDASMGLFEVFEDQLCAAGPVEGEDDGAEGAEQSAKRAGDAGFHVASVDELAVEGANHCTIGRDEGRIRSEVEAFEQGEGVGDAPAGGDGDGDAGRLRGSEGLGVAAADGLRRRRLGSRVPSMSMATRRTGGCIGLVYRADVGQRIEAGEAIG